MSINRKQPKSGNRAKSVQKQETSHRLTDMMARLDVIPEGDYQKEGKD
jgi:hypothetical protein